MFKVKSSLQSNRISDLKAYFEKEPSVILAFLFGSQTTGMNREVSDWDIGIYLTEGKNMLEKENKIWREIEDILKTEVDLIFLDKARPLLASRIIRQGIPLVIKDRGFFLDFLLKITEQADYFQRFSHDYYQIYQRSRSLNETDRNRLEKIIIFLENEMRDFEKFETMNQVEYEKDISKRREIERWIENLMNSSLDIAKIILASEKKDLPDTYKKIVFSLSIIPGFEVCQKLSNWIELRNILAHEYLDIRWGRISDFLENGKPYLEKFLDQTKKFIEKSV